MTKNQLFATTLQHAPGGGVAVPVYSVLGFPNETLEQLAARVEMYIERQYRKVNGPNGYSYEILLGEITHEIEQPKPKSVKIQTREFKDPAFAAGPKPTRKTLKTAA